ncbi:TonB-dependent siderophore receptor [Verrucomicrobium sp. BvORR034]|uniref:TonB-dependent siderophore receptor n=1 Tax=Verrucomicrobium sp. BvORR034 TaxID=1396418 RepID=UPI00067982CB|nr:TonB-dependent siderophore receptor [Verrucomicrobium sp. BvORR034]
MKRKHNNLISTPAAITVCCGLAASSLLGQSSPPPATPKPEDTETMAEVVVTSEFPIRYLETSTTAALFSDIPLIETPFSVSVYNEELIEDRRAFTLKDILQHDPSIAIQMPGGFYGTQNFGLRGFRVDNFNGYRMDGVPIINTVAPTLDDKARVELLKGPSALQYGFMPPGGAINLVRKHPQADATSLQFDVDTFGSVYGQIDTSDVVAGGKFGYRLVLAADEFDSFYNNADGNRFMGSLYTEWKPTDGVNIWTAIGGQDLERSGYYGPMITANGRVLDTGVKTNIMQDWARNEQQTFDAAVGIDAELNEDWKVRLAVNYQDAQRDSRLSYPYSVLENGDFTDGALLTNGPFEWESWGIHAHVEGNFNTGSLKHKTVFGTQWRAYDTSGERSFPDVGPNNAYNLSSLPIPAAAGWTALDFEYNEIGVFATDIIEFNEYWSILLGGRFGRFENTYPTDPASDDTVDAWTPTAALMFSPTENVHTYLTYTQGVQDGGTASRAATNAFAPLGVQRSEQFELGVKTELLEGRLAGELALFQIDQDLAAMNPATGIESFSGVQRHRGIEVTLRGKITDSLQTGFAFMLLDAEQKDTGYAELDGRTPQYVPEYQANLWAILDIPQVPGLSLNANARFVDKQYLDQTEQFATDSYVVVDVGATYRRKIADADWTFRVGIRNLLDERYYESGEFYPGDAGYLAHGSPISAVFSIQVDF